MTGFGDQRPTIGFHCLLANFFFFGSVVASSKDSYQLRFYNIAYVLCPLIFGRDLCFYSGAGEDDDDE